MLKILFILWYISASLILSSCDQQYTNLDTILKKEKPPVSSVFKKDGVPVVVKVTFSSTTLSLLDTLTLTISIETDRSINVRPFYLPVAAYAPLELFRTPKYSKHWKEDMKTLVQKWQFQLDPQVSGNFTLKPFKVFYEFINEKDVTDNGVKIQSISTHLIPYSIQPGKIPEEASLRKIKGAIQDPFNSTPLITSLIILLILFIVVQGVRYYFTSKIESHLPPQDIDYQRNAIEALQKLEQKDYNTAEDLNQLHIQISSIIRKYIEFEFLIPAQEQTTEEFLKTISQQTAFTANEGNLLEELLTLADLVKFAAFSPIKNISLSSLQKAREFVIATGNKKNGI